MSSTCLRCGGTGILVNGDRCTECEKDTSALQPMVYGVPAQYQGVKFDKSFLPEKFQKTYGEFMEELMHTILTDYAFYQKNILICSKPNTGKTVWTYNLYSELSSKGYEIPTLRDIIEVRNILNSYADKDEANLISNARCMVVKIPKDIQFWMFDTLSSLVERRVRNDGFTIFLFGGSKDDLKYADKYGRLRDLEGTGAYNSIKIYDFN